MVVVFYDLSTTGFKPGNQIVQIGAITSRGYKFSTYILPTIDVEPQATRINALIYSWTRNALFDSNTGLEIQAVDRVSGINKFLDYLKMVSSNGRDKIILVAHSNSRFDSWVLKRNMEELRIPLNLDVEMADSMEIMAHLERNTDTRFPNGKSLSECSTVFGQQQIQPRDARNNASDCRLITLAAAAKLGYKARYGMVKINRFFEINPGLKKKFTVDANRAVVYCNIGGLTRSSSNEYPYYLYNYY